MYHIAAGFVAGAVVGAAAASSRSSAPATAPQQPAQTTSATTVVYTSAPPPPAATLPCKADTLNVNGVTYYRCGQSYYMQAYGNSGPVYMPVQPPQ